MLTKWSQFFAEIEDVRNVPQPHSHLSVYGSVTNREIAELLAVQAETDEFAPDHRRRAFRRAARAALSWPQSVHSLHLQGVPLAACLRGVGPYLETVIRHWLEEPPEIPEPPPIRAGFQSRDVIEDLIRCGPARYPIPCGDLHVHSSWSDGKDTLWELAEAAEARGYSYLAITDHGAKLPVAKGLKLPKLLEQGERLREINEELQHRGFRVRLLRSSELNFNKHGGVDYDPEILQGLDWTIAAYHSQLQVTEDQTPRYLAALNNPWVDVHAHPICRIFDQRMGLTADWDRVCARAAEVGKALEIDGIPDRQDMSPSLLEFARKHDVFVSLGSDSHSVTHFGYINFAVVSAIEAGIRPERILNLMSYGQLMDWRQERIERHLAGVGQPISCS